MNGLTIFGVIAVTAMLVFYAVEARSPHFVLAFAAACLMGSVYGFLQGAWPFGIVEGIWSGVALRRWWRQRQGSGSSEKPSQRANMTPLERSANGIGGESW
jgi:hypothetical protein